MTATTQQFSEALYIFQRKNPAQAAWLREKSAEGNEFAVSLLGRLTKGEALTPNQAAALDRIVLGTAAPGAAPAPAAAKVEVAPLVASLTAAKDAGLKRPSLLTEAFKFSRAPDHGTNPGAIYVTARDTGTYLGKIIGGELLPVRECGPETRDQIVAVCADPLTAAIAYGKKYGICSCCNRELTDPDSIALGIGPVCKKKYGL